MALEGLRLVAWLAVDVFGFLCLHGVCPDGPATVLWGISGKLCLLAALTMTEKADSLWFLVKKEFWVGAAVAWATADVPRN